MGSVEVAGHRIGGRYGSGGVIVLPDFWIFFP